MLKGMFTSTKFYGSGRIIAILDGGFLALILLFLLSTALEQPNFRWL
jgi:hypothetical protein